MAQYPLSHIRVLDLSRILAGPLACQTLADLGAEVIKVERPGRGDDTREWGPPYLNGGKGEYAQESAYYLSANRGKQSVTVDISKPEGQDIIRALAAKSDILVENYKVGGLAAYGLGYGDLKGLNKGLIYCSITGFGQSGPYKDRAGYDFVTQAMGGLMSVTGEADGRPGGGPQKLGVAVSDLLTGLYTTIASLAALALRERTGEGQHIDMALFDVVVASMTNQAMSYLLTGVAPGRMGNAHQVIVPYGAFATADDYMILAAGNDSQYANFCKVAGRDDLAADPRFATNQGRVKHRDILVPIITDIIAERPRADWLTSLSDAGVPCGPINDLAQIFDDPQVKHRGMRVSLDHVLAGKVDHVANPIKYSNADLRLETSAPTLGQHTDQVLGELLGYDAGHISRLRDAGIV